MLMAERDAHRAPWPVRKHLAARERIIACLGWCWCWCLGWCCLWFDAMSIFSSRAHNCLLRQSSSCVWFEAMIIFNIEPSLTQILCAKHSPIFSDKEILDIGQTKPFLEQSDGAQKIERKWCRRWKNLIGRDFRLSCEKSSYDSAQCPLQVPSAQCRVKSVQPSYGSAHRASISAWLYTGSIRDTPGGDVFFCKEVHLQYSIIVWLFTHLCIKGTLPEAKLAPKILPVGSVVKQIRAQYG